MKSSANGCPWLARKIEIPIQHLELDEGLDEGEQTQAQLWEDWAGLIVWNFWIQQYFITDSNVLFHLWLVYNLWFLLNSQLPLNCIFSWIKSSFKFVTELPHNWITVMYCTWSCPWRSSRSCSYFTYCTLLLSCFFFKLHWLSVGFQVKFKVLVIIFKVHQGKGLAI